MRIRIYREGTGYQLTILLLSAAMIAGCQQAAASEPTATPTDQPRASSTELTTEKLSTHPLANAPVPTSPPAATAVMVMPTTTPAPLPVPAPTSTPAPTPAPLSMRDCAQAHSMHIGAAVAANPLRNDPLYAATLAEYFGMVTPENAMKFGPLHPEPDRYDFADADLIVDFAQAQGMQVRGHTLVWHNQLPGWLTNKDWSKEELMAILRDHIHTVVGRYRGRVMAWDVVNEGLNDDGTYRDTIWLRTIGPEYIDLAFRWAHEADPNALLFYNDYGAEGTCQKADAVYELVTGLMERGVPIHGVGFQMHVGLDWCPGSEGVAANIDRLNAVGLQVHITEMDVRVPEPATEEKLQAQAAIYEDMVRVCMTSRNCTAFVLWGFTDNYSWVPGFFPGYGSALIFDKDYRPKPACEALEDAVTGN